MSILKVRIGARSSTLSKVQVSIVSELIRAKAGGGLEVEVVPVKTLGDRVVPSFRADLNKGGDKWAFTGDIERLLLQGEIDLAVHSMKDLASEETEGLMIGAVPPRGDPRDALVSDRTISELDKGARVGTSSVRRRVQLLHMRPDLKVVEIHGNVDTRLRKLGLSELDGLVLAVAGLERIGEASRISQTFSMEEMVPAVGQGIIAVQTRSDDKQVGALLAKINDKKTALEAACERGFARALGADCNVPVGACARVSGDAIRLVGMIAKGRHLTRESVEGPAVEGPALGKALARRLKGRRSSS